MTSAPQRDIAISARKIAIVVGSLNRGGCETHLLQVLPRLDRARFAVEVFTLAEPGHLAAAMQAEGVPVRVPWVRSDGRRRAIVFRLFRLTVTSVQFWLYLLRRRPALAHFFLPQAYLVGAPLAMLAGVHRRVMSRRSLNIYQSKHRGIASAERWLHRRMRAVVGNSCSVLAELIRQEGVPPQRALLIYNGREAPVASCPAKAVRTALGLGADAVVLTIVANLIPYKGHADLINACGRLRTDKAWKLLCVGQDNGLRAHLQAQADALGLGCRVRFLGERTDVPNLLAASDIGVLSSHEEGFSNAILEGMAAGLPMVVTDVGGNGEAVANGQTGLIVPPRDPAALALALQRLIDDTNLRTAMGRAGRKRVFAQFSITACVNAYNALYDAVLNDRSVDTLPGLRARDHGF